MQRLSQAIVAHAESNDDMLRAPRFFPKIERDWDALDPRRLLGTAEVDNP